MMAAALLHRGITVLTNVPALRDVTCMVDILESLGCRCCHKGDCLVMDARNITATRIPKEYVTAMRSSIVMLGVLLGRMGEGSCCYPGGCLIGSRPIDLHLMALKCLGAELQEKNGVIEARCRYAKGMKGAEIHLPFPSVGATEQTILAAVLARDVTVIHGAAREPEIVHLCHFLNNMGAVICGMGTGCLMIQGVKELHDSSFRVAGDRIVAGTYAAAAAAATGSILIKGISPDELTEPLRVLAQAGADVRIEDEERQIKIGMQNRPMPLNIKTGPYPAFPTDLQSVFMAFLVVATGRSTIEEQVFEGRFATAKELVKMGASIETAERTAVIEGRRFLNGALVKASDLRGGAALVVAALAAEGETIIEDCRHIERGYEDICRDMTALGAAVRWIGE